MSREQFDILDSNGLATGKVMPADDVHAQQLWHGVAHIWIYNSKGEMLMQLRHPKKSWGGNKWDLAGGGHIIAGEDPVEGALREAREEIGVNLKPEDLKFIGLTTTRQFNEKWNLEHRVLSWNYIAERETDISILKLQDDEAVEVRWFKLDQIEKDLRNPETAKKYTPRDEYQFLMATTEARNELLRKKRGEL